MTRMRHTSSHVGDEDLLLLLDGELPAKRADEVRAHVSACSACRATMEKIEGAASEFDQMYRADGNRDALAHASARANLRRRLASDSPPAAWRLARWANPSSLRGWAYVSAAVLLGAALGLGWLHRQSEPRDAAAIAAVESDGPLLPDSRLTPGATRPVTENQICVAGGPAERKPPVTLQRAVFHEYGMDSAPPRAYEVDHLITPALGGTDDIRNLWPEPYAAAQWNAHVKDELEDHLHDLVCGGKLDLTTAQRDMASNWILAYKKYFHSDEPLAHTSDLIENRRRTPKS
ncbi:MAG TPA: zf-HC2 domain-containing protein [Candidatus Aquilonibacter sp.]|nr:zf-HC2 domain-containing protein [Candidatus Aquilonibacter sp.]